MELLNFYLSCHSCVHRAVEIERPDIVERASERPRSVEPYVGHVRRTRRVEVHGVSNSGVVHELHGGSLVDREHRGVKGAR